MCGVYTSITANDWTQTWSCFSVYFSDWKTRRHLCPLELKANTARAERLTGTRDTCTQCVWCSSNYLRIFVIIVSGHVWNLCLQPILIFNFIHLFSYYCQCLYNPFILIFYVNGKRHYMAVAHLACDSVVGIIPWKLSICWLLLYKINLITLDDFNDFIYYL